LRLAGFRKFTESLYKARFQEYSDDTKRAASIADLGITYTTLPISTFITNELKKPAESRPMTEDRSDAQLTQSSPWSEILARLTHPTIGLSIQDRRWHLRYYEKVFIGSECVDWLVRNFSDIDSRDDAVTFGNALLQKNVIEHVNKRYV
jgi:hypothetical protein